MRVRSCLPSHSQSCGHRLGGEFSRLSRGFPSIPGGSWLSPGAPASTTERLTLLCPLHYTFFAIFSLFQDTYLHCFIPPFLCPGSQATAPYSFVLIAFNSATSLLKPAVPVTWRSQPVTAAVLIPAQVALQVPTPQSAPTMCDMCWVPYT